MNRKYYDLNYIHREELKILEYFDAYCKQENIKYSLSGGTLLGAIRHGGFIPWDDDIDILMLRQEYEKLCRVVKEKNNFKYFLQNYETDNNYLNNFAKIVNTEIPAYIEEVEQLDIKKGICIDVFPIDRVETRFLFQIYYRLIMSVLSVLKYSLMSNKRDVLHKIFRKVVSLVTVKRINEVENRIRKYSNKTCSPWSYADYIKPPYTLKSKDLFPYEIFTKYTTISFEGKDLMVISNYKIYLGLTYGDYMTLPTEDKRKPDHNFYYYEQTRGEC